MDSFFRIKLDFPNAEKLRTVFAALDGFVAENGWAGSCHATSAVLFAVAKRLGIDATLCIGEAQVGDVVFDHSWVEIAGMPYDVSIEMPLQSRFLCAPVLAGYDIITAKETEVKYGVKHEGLGPQAAMTLSLDVYDYMAGCPEPDLFRLTMALCGMVGKPIDEEWMRENLKGVKRKYVVAN